MAPTLQSAFASYRSALERFNPDEDVATLKQVRDANAMLRLVDKLFLPEAVTRLLDPLVKYLDTFVDSVAQRWDNTDVVRHHVWGSIYLLCQITAESIPATEIRQLNPVKLIYECGAELSAVSPASHFHAPDGVPWHLYEEMYAIFIGFCGEVICFLRDHQHAALIKTHWHDIQAASDKTALSLRSIATKARDSLEEAHHSRNHVELSDLRDMIQTLSTSPTESRRTCYYHLPTILNRSFQGRDEALQQLREHFAAAKRDDRFVTVALHGYPGSGKTQLALQLAHSAKKSGSFSAVLWLVAASREKLAGDACTIAERLGLLPANVSPGEKIPLARQRLLEWLNEFEGNWLVVLDNVTSFDDIRDYYPTHRGGCGVIITSRDHAIGSTAVSLRLTVRDLSVEDTANLILSILGEVPRTDENVETARDIGRELGGLPLLINQAGAYIRKYGCGLRNFLPFYRRSWQNVHRAQVGLPDYSATISSLWQLSLQGLQPEHRELIEILALLQPDRIPSSMFTDTSAISCNREHLQPIFDGFFEMKHSLGQACLIQNETDSGDMNIHRVTQSVVLDAISQPTRSTRFEDAVAVVTAAFPKGLSAAAPDDFKAEKWNLAQECLPHVCNLADAFERLKIQLEPSSGFPQLLSNTCWYLFEISQFQHALDLLPLAERICEDRRLRASTRSIRAVIMARTPGKEQIAVRIWHENLELRKELDGEAHWLVGNNYLNLSLGYGSLGNAELSRYYYDELRKHEEKYNPPNKVNIARFLTKYSAFSIAAGDFDMAEAVINESISRLRELEREEEFNHSEALYMLAQLRVAQNRLGEALALHHKILRSRLKNMPFHTHTCCSFYNTAHVADLLQDHETAISLLQQSIDSFSPLPDARPHVARALFRGSMIYTDGLGDQAKADEWRGKAKALLAQIGSDRSGDVLDDYEERIILRYR